jgi:hypothetical protein
MTGLADSYPSKRPMSGGVILTADQVCELVAPLALSIERDPRGYQVPQLRERLRVLLASHEAQARAIRQLQAMVAWRDGLLIEIESKPHRAEEVTARWRAAGDTKQGETP